MLHDFSKQSLRGRSYRGQDLSGRSFRGADIRGTDFTGAKLVGADFSDAIAGLQRRWAIALLAVSFLLAAIAGIFSTSTGLFINFLFFPGYPDYSGDTPIAPLPGLDWDTVSNFTIMMVLACFVAFAIFFAITLRKGMKAALIAIATALILLWVASFAVAIIYALTVQPATLKIILEGNIQDFDRFTAEAWQAAGSGVKLFAAVGLAILTVALCTVVVSTGALLVSIVMGVAVVTAETVFGEWAGGLVAATVAGIIFLESIPGVGVVLFLAGQANAMPWTVLGALISTFAMIGTVATLGSCVSWQALQGETKFAFIRKLAFNLAATGGTKFRQADLTDANFANARLKSTDLRAAKMFRTRWFKTQALEQARVGKTYLCLSAIQQLVVTGDGRNGNFDRQNLQGIHLQQATLTDASFIGADLYQADLRASDLSRAKLVRANLAQANLSGACLTGACIQDWGATASTQLESVVCDYIYMRLPTDDNPDPNRIPHQDQFQAGEFQQLMHSLLNTLDLYHEQDVEAKAVISALRSLASETEASLEIIALENRDNGIAIKLKLEAEDRDEIRERYFQRYQHYLSNQPPAISSQDAALAQQLDQAVQHLQQRLMNCYFHNHGILVEGKIVNAHIDQSQCQTVELKGNNLEVSGAGALGLGNISGTVANTIQQTSRSETAARSELDRLINQLRREFETELNLTAEVKHDALEEIATLTMAERTPQATGMPKLVRVAIRVLRGTIADLPPDSSAVVRCNLLLNAIAQQLAPSTCN